MTFCLLSDGAGLKFNRVHSDSPVGSSLRFVHRLFMRCARVEPCFSDLLFYLLSCGSPRSHLR
jgi:hypothetical protein